MERTTFTFTVDGREYTYRGYLGAADALLIKQHAGLSAMELFTGILTADPASLVALVFLAKRQSGEKITWDETVELLDGENDLMALVDSIKLPEDDELAEAQPKPATRRRKTAEEPATA